jgi:hypothetical protein
MAMAEPTGSAAGAAAKTGKSEKPAKAEMPAKAETAAKTETAVQTEAAAKTEKADKLDKPEKAKKPPQARAPYTSVVYVHGMGSQRRYEETSLLVDQIDRYVGGERRAGQSVGLLSNIKARVEPCRSKPGSTDIVGYIRTVFTPGPKMEQAETVRFYEIYWAPVMAEQRSMWGVVQWLFAQPLRPWRTLRSPWRERQRLRRASLVALSEKAQPRPSKEEEGDYTDLIARYDDFEGPEAQRLYPEGTFDQFLAFIATRAADPPVVARRQELARAWLAAYRREELTNAFVLATMALALLLCAGLAVVGVLALLQAALGFAPLAGLLQTWNVQLKADWSTAAAIAGALVVLIGFSRFLTDYMGDVETWATYEETDAKHVARNKVLEQSIELFTHVLRDEACERVVVVAHSLGASIAHDALLALTRRNRAHNPDDAMQGLVPLHKIEHFVTMGSPIDKIEYFFESYSSTSHRYKRVVETLRGDIGTEPFSRNHKPHIHWINFWDQGDSISGALHSPANGATFAQRVDNVHVMSFGFPATGASHGGYFTNRTVIKTLFETIYLRGLSFRTLTQPAPGKPYDYDSVYIGPGEGQGARTAHLAAILALPWLGLAGGIAWLAQAQTLACGIWGLAGLLTLGVGLTYFASATRGQRNPV